MALNNSTQSSAAGSTPATAGRDQRDGNRRSWQWYHFYFLLALFDVLIIVASLVLHNRTLSSYEVALGELGVVASKQRWVADMRLAVVALNAPGNDVFESRQVDDERQRAAETLAMLRAQILHKQRFETDLSEFQTRIDAMVEAQNTIFALFERINQPQASGVAPGDLLQEASVFMAAMDRRTADAMDALSDVERVLIREQNRLQEAYGRRLEQRGMIEKYFLVVVVVILILVLFYGRTLQQKHALIEAEQRRAKKEREDRLASIGELSGAVAHGIRNPLAAITSSAQLALEFGDMDDNTRTRLQDVITSAERLNQRSTRLLNFAQAGQERFARFDLAADARQVVEELRPRFDALGIQVHAEVSDNGLAVVGDRDRIVQSIIELLSNAMDSVSEDGCVKLVCRRDPQTARCAEISVIDNGPGIPDHMRQQVFDLFFSSKPDGTGVGLASVKRAIDMHNGQVEIDSAPGGGTCVRIRLPLNARK